MKFGVVIGAALRRSAYRADSVAVTVANVLSLFPLMTIGGE